MGTTTEITMTTTKTTTSSITLIFADVDGTLVHYPEITDSNKNKTNDEDDITSSSSSSSNNNNDHEQKILYLPPSSTGLRGVISSQTLSLCQQLRRKKDVK